MLFRSARVDDEGDGDAQEEGDGEVEEEGVSADTGAKGKQQRFILFVGACVLRVLHGDVDLTKSIPQVI